MAELSEADVQFVKDLRQAKEEGRISRRDALKVAGALGLGGVVGGAGGASMFGTAAGGASTSDSDGNVGLPGDRVDVYADGVDGISAGLENVQYTGNVLHTITVRKDGSGDATSISGAIDQVPAIGIDNGKTVSVRFDLGAGETYSIDNPQIGLPWCGGIQFKGDGTNPPTLQVGSGSVGLQVVRSNVRFDDVNFSTGGTGQASHYVFAQYGSRVDMNNVQASGDVDKAIEALYASTVLVDGASTISGANTTGSQGANIHSSSHLRLDGQIDNFDVGVHLDRNGTADIIGATVDSCTTGVEAEDGANGKVTNSSAVTNHSTGFVVQADGTIKLDGTADLTGNTSNYSVNDVSKLKDNSGTWQTGAAT